MKNSNAALKPAATEKTVTVGKLLGAVFTGPDMKRAMNGVNDNVMNPSNEAVANDVGVKAIKAAFKLSKDTGEPVVIRTTVTPVTAAWLLRKNIKNRRVSEPTVIKYSDDMKNGRWVENGDGISVAICGALNNGQHRLVSVMRAGVEFKTNVTVGLTRKSRATNDIGLKRSISSVLGMNGVDNHTIVAPMVNLIMGWEETGTAAKRPTRENSDTKIQERVEGDKQIEEAATYARKHRAKARGVLSAPQMGFLHFVLKNHASNEAEAFLTPVATGMEPSDDEGNTRGLCTSDCRYVLRERLIRDNKHLKHSDRVELVFRAWNAWREGRSISRYMINGNIPELV